MRKFQSTASVEVGNLRGENRFHIELKQGRKIFLHELIQWLTYDGLLCGRPTIDVNDSIIHESYDRAKKNMPWGGEPFIITPVQKPMQRRPDDFEDHACIPTVACCAAFICDGAVHDPDSHASCMIFVWFQKEFGLPEDAIQREIQKIDWGVLATDFQY